LHLVLNFVTIGRPTRIIIVTFPNVFAVTRSVANEEQLPDRPLGPRHIQGVVETPLYVFGMITTT
jgi:hypothetical protein